MGLSEDTGPRLKARHTLVDRRMLRDATRARLAVGALVACGLMSTATVVIQAAVLAKLLSGAFGVSRHGNREILLFWLAGALVLRALVAIVTELVANHAATLSKSKLRSLLVGGILESSARAGADGAGDVATLAGRGLDALDVYVGRCIPDLVLAAAAPIALVCAVGAFDWVSALVLACVVGLFPLFGVLVGRSGTRLANERWRQVRELGDHLLDVFEGLPVLKAFGRSADEREKVRTAGEALPRGEHRHPSRRLPVCARPGHPCLGVGSPRRRAARPPPSRRIHGPLVCPSGARHRPGGIRAVAQG